MTLVEFLKARLDEDEALAQTAGRVTWPSGTMRPDEEDFLNRFHDERVLAEAAAKRRIVNEHFGFLNPSGPTRACRICSDRRADDDPLVRHDRWVRLEPAPCRTVRLLALPYASHPDYREEWKP